MCVSACVDVCAVKMEIGGQTENRLFQLRRYKRKSIRVFEQLLNRQPQSICSTEGSDGGVVDKLLIMEASAGGIVDKLLAVSVAFYK